MILGEGWMSESFTRAWRRKNFRRKTLHLSAVASSPLQQNQSVRRLARKVDVGRRTRQTVGAKVERIMTTLKLSRPIATWRERDMTGYWHNKLRQLRVMDRRDRIRNAQRKGKALVVAWPKEGGSPWQVRAEWVNSQGEEQVQLFISLAHAGEVMEKLMEQGLVEGMVSCRELDSGQEYVIDGGLIWEV